MKKIRLSRKRKQVQPETPDRITNETVAEHREKVLAGGRRFKYPVQYAKHRLVINTIIISLVALIAITIMVWWQLYPSQNTSTFFYRITRVLPLPVATIDNHPVRYSDYLAKFRSQEHYLHSKEGIDLYSKENKERLDAIKRKMLDNAIADGYAEKLAKEEGIKITPEQIDDDIKRQRESRDGLASQETYDAIMLDLYNWTREELREQTARKLLRQEVAYKIDKTALQLRDAMTQQLQTEMDFDKLAAAIPAVDGVKVESGVSPLVPRNNMDGGLARAASKLSVGQVSPAFRSTTGDGYYVVKTLQKDGEDRVSYAYLKVPLTVFQKKLEKVKSETRFNEFISVPGQTKPSTTKK